MGKKDKKKGKGAEKTAAKTEKKFNQKLKKELASKGEEDIESLLAKFSEEDKKKNSVIEELSQPPSKRSSFSLTAHPDKDQLLLFGGEYFNGNKTFVYNDFYFYNIKQNRWIKLTSPGGPPPRNSHQAVAFSRSGGQLWIFGGEFTSATQSQFYHYKDLWLFNFNSKRWEKIVGHGSGPCSRSGHRMVGLKNQLIIFGGFQDNSRVYKYFNDVYIFNLETYTWNKIEPSGNGPCPRSACQMLPTSDERVLVYGGYSKDKVKKDVEKGVTHSDMFILTPDKRDTTGLKWKWVSCKQSGAIPTPRCAFSMCSSAVDRAVLFGGVCDTESEEELYGIFYDDLYQFDIAKMRWFELEVTGKKDEIEHEKRRRRKVKDNQEEEEEVNEEMDELKLEEEKEKVISDDGIFTLTVSDSCQSSGKGAAGETSKESQLKDVFSPPPRINPGLAVKKGVLYMYGGMYEEGDKQLTLNDFYSLDLDKLEDWNIIISLNEKDMEWFDSDSESDDDEEGAEDEDNDDNDDDDNDGDDNDEESSKESAEEEHMDTN